MAEETKDSEAARAAGKEEIDFNRYAENKNFQAIVNVFEGLHGNKESNKLSDDQIMNRVIDAYYEGNESYKQMDDNQKENARRELAERITRFEEIKAGKEAEQANAPISQKIKDMVGRAGLTGADSEQASYAAAASFFAQADKVAADAEKDAKYASEAASLKSVLDIINDLRNNNKLVNFNDKKIIAQAVDLHFAGDGNYKQMDDEQKRIAREEFTKRILAFEKMRAEREAGGPSRYEQLSQDVVNFSESVRTSVNNLSDKVQSGISGLGEGVRSGVTNFSKEVQDSVANFNKGVSERIQAGVAALNTAKDNVNNDLSATYDQILQRYKELGDRVQTGVANFSNGVQTSVANFSNGVQTSVTNFSNGVRSGVEGLSEGVRNSVTNLSNGVHTSVTNFSNGVQAGVTNLSKEVQTSVANFSKELNSKIQAGVATITAAKENALKGLASATHYEQISQMCKDLSEGIQTSVTNFSNGVHTSVTNFSNGVHTSVTNLKESVHAGIDGFSDRVRGGVEGVRNGVTNLKEGVRDGVTNLSNDVRTRVTNVSNDVRTSLANFSKEVQAGMAGLSDAKEKALLVALLPVAVGVLGASAVKEGATAVKDKIKDVDLSATYDQILQRYKELGDRVQTGVANFSNGVQTSVANFSNGVQTSVTNFSNGVRSGVEGLSEGVRNSVTNLSNGVHTSVTNFSNGVQAGVTNLSKEVQTSVANFSKELNSKIQAGVATITAAKENALKGLASATHYEQISQMCKDLSEGIQTSVTNFSNGVHTSVTNFSNGVHTSVTNLKESVHAGIDGIKESVQAKADNIKESVTNLGAGVKEGVTNLGAGVKEGVTNLGTGVKESVSNIRKSVGNRVQAGVANLREQLFGGNNTVNFDDPAVCDKLISDLKKAYDDEKSKAKDRIMKDFYVKNKITNPKDQAAWREKFESSLGHPAEKGKQTDNTKQTGNTKVNLASLKKQGARS